MARNRPFGAAVLLVFCAGAQPAWPSPGAADAAVAKADAAYERGLRALDREDYERAADCFTEAVELDPEFTDAWMARGYVHAELGQLRRAVADYTETLRLDPRDAETWCNRGHTRAKLGQLDQAIDDLNRAIRLQPDLVPAYHSRGWVYTHQGAYEKAAADYSEALRLGGDNPHLRFDRAVCRSFLRQYAGAVEDLTAAIAVEPGDLRFYGARGAAWVYLGEYERGAADLRRAIAMNEYDVGQRYEPWGRAELDAEALRHGRRQVERMLRDRPRMARHAGRTGFLEQWAARKFAGEDVGVTIDWDPSVPTDSDAEHVAPGRGRRGRIRIAPIHQWGPQRGTERTFEQLWSNAVFELHNIAYGPRFRQLHRQAGAGTISKEQFVEGIWTYEHQAAQQTRAFYVQVYLPWAARHKLKTDPALWFAALWEDAGRTFDGFTDRTTYPWRPYARQYDWATVRRLFHDGRFREALALLHEMAPAAEYPRDAPHAWLMAGRCRLELGQAAEAVAALSRAVELDADYAEAYRARADAYRLLGRMDEAAADSARARRLER